jgi:hypothetical protein
MISTSTTFWYRPSNTGKNISSIARYLAKFVLRLSRYVYQLFYPWALFFVKASILALYHRIFTYHSFRRWVYYAAGFIIIQTITVTFINAFECGTKPSRAWDVKFPEGRNSMPKTYFAMASVNIVTDIVILVMPLKVFKELNMHPRKRRTYTQKLSCYNEGADSDKRT